MTTYYQVIDTAEAIAETTPTRSYRIDGTPPTLPVPTGTDAHVHRIPGLWTNLIDASTSVDPEGLFVSFYLEELGPGAGPEIGDQLIVEYLDWSLEWQEVGRIFASGSGEAVFRPVWWQLPSDANYNGLRVRILADGIGDTTDYWYVDNLQVSDGRPAGIDVAPTLLSVTPDRCSVDGLVQVELEGTGFSPGMIVTVDGTPASGIEFINNTRLRCTIPPASSGIGDVDLRVESTLGDFDTIVFRYTADELFVTPLIFPWVTESTVSATNEQYVGGMSFGVSYPDLAELQVTGIDSVSSPSPDFFQGTIGTGGSYVVGVIWGVSPSDALPPGTQQAIAEAQFEYTGGSSLFGSLSVEEGLGDPPVPALFTDMTGLVSIRPAISGAVAPVGWDPGTSTAFIRGDANDDATIDITDPIVVLSYLFGSGAIPCEAAANANGDDIVDIADPVFLLAHLFIPGSDDPPPPFPSCGTETDLPCDASSCP